MTDDELDRETGRLHRERQRLTEERRVLEERARRYTQALRAAADALEHPERIRVAIEPGTIVVRQADWILIAAPLPTLTQISELAKTLRALDSRLAEIRGTLNL